MGRIGICTMYFENRNYGAVLQAYALRYILKNKFNKDAEVISYRDSTKFIYLLSKIKNCIKSKDEINKKINSRNRIIDSFSCEIEHSKLYYSNTLKKANKTYDCFIAGSDQIWRPMTINQFYSLDFVDKGKRTAAYAASTGRVVLNDEEKKKIEPALKNTKYISIRENDSISALQELTDKKIEYVLDPTMLLSDKQWDEICSERLIKEEYLFCYFLGGNDNLRSVAYDYAKKRNLKIVTIPFLGGKFRKTDDKFGDYMLFDISPREFLSLIKFSSFVITDSFHATVFSHIYKRNFLAVCDVQSASGCRMKSLVELFGTDSHFIHDYNSVTFDSILSIEKEELNLDTRKFEIVKQKSFDFLNRVVNYD